MDTLARRPYIQECVFLAMKAPGISWTEALAMPTRRRRAVVRAVVTHLQAEADAERAAMPSPE